MKKFLILAFALLWISELKSQSNIFREWHLGISYYGNNLWNPGLQITGQKVFFDRTKTKIKKNDIVKTKYRQMYLDANLGFFYDNPTYFAIFNNYEVQYRKVRQKGKYRSIGLGPGMMRTLLPETYQLNGSGSFTRVKYPGKWYFAPVISAGTGRLWKQNGTNPWRIQLHAMLITNYNASANILVNLEYGYVFGYRNKQTKSMDDDF